MSIPQRHRMSISSASTTVSFVVNTVGDTTVIAVGGELDPCVSPLLAELVDEILSVTAPRRLVLDFAGVNFMCAAGIHALLSARRSVAARDGQLSLRNPSAITRRVLAATGDLQYFQVRGSADGPAGAGPVRGSSHQRTEPS